MVKFWYFHVRTKPLEKFDKIAEIDFLEIANKSKLNILTSYNK